MASRLFAKRKVIAYLPNLRTAVKNIRSFSSTIDHEHGVPLEDSSADSQTVWPDTNLGPFGQQDRRFPLPGQTGPSSNLVTLKEKEKDVVDPMSLLGYQNYKRQLQVLTDMVDASNAEMEGYLEEPTGPTPSDCLECVAQECPDTLKKDFQGLFTSQNVMTGDLTVVTISQKTINDMSGWSMQVEEEREELLETFIQGAMEICEVLRGANYWADFIDPSCGKPYFGAHTNHTLFETDERYTKLGFEIEDLGCCKVIRHHIWGTHSYVGCIFTNAPLSYSLFQSMVK